MIVAASTKTMKGHPRVALRRFWAVRTRALIPDSSGSIRNAAARRNGNRERAFETRLGTLDLTIPKLRSGSYFPSFLEPRRDTTGRATADAKDGPNLCCPLLRGRQPTNAFSFDSGATTIKP